MIWSYLSFCHVWLQLSKWYYINIVIFIEILMIYTFKESQRATLIFEMSNYLHFTMSVHCFLNFTKKRPFPNDLKRKWYLMSFPTFCMTWYLENVICANASLEWIFAEGVRNGFGVMAYLFRKFFSMNYPLIKNFVEGYFSKLSWGGKMGSLYYRSLDKSIYRVIKFWQ